MYVGASRGGDFRDSVKSMGFPQLFLLFLSIRYRFCRILYLQLMRKVSAGGKLVTLSPCFTEKCSAIFYGRTGTLEFPL
jgi:hypothetical protein